MKLNRDKKQSSNSHIGLEKLKIYGLSRDLSRTAWSIYEALPKDIKYGAGSQFLDATDSTADNIAEGFGRFHYLDKIKFYYNARGSLLELRHWFEVLIERKLVKDEKIKKEYLEAYTNLRPALNAFISSVYKKKVGGSGFL